MENKKPKLLVILRVFPSPYQPWVSDFLEQMLKSDWQVDIVSRNYADSPPSSLNKLISSNLKDKTIYINTNTLLTTIRSMHPLLFPFSTNGIMAYKGLVKLFKLNILFTSHWKSILKILANTQILAQNPDILHIHQPVIAFEYIFLIKALKIPLIVSFHGFSEAGINSLPESKKRMLWNHMTFGLVNTKYAARLLEKAGCPKEKITIIPQGISTNAFPYKPQKYPEKDQQIVLLSVGRLDEGKGHIFAIRAVAKLVQKGNNIKYNIVGDGPERNNLEAEIKKLGLKAHIHFTGTLVGDNLKNQYSGAHIFIMSSITTKSGMAETQGVTVQEALASGNIVIATRTGGIPECTDNGRIALLVEEQSTEEIENKVTRILNHPEHWIQLQSAGRNWVEENYDIKKTTARVIKLYRTAINNY